MDESDQQFEQGGAEVLLWAMWAGLGLATVGEVVLFLFMGGTASGAGAGLPLAQLGVVGGFTTVMIALVVLVRSRNVAGGGFPTALICWVLLKSVAITGLVVYQLAGQRTYYWPFLAAFGVGMLILNPLGFIDE